jgi:CBS domain containing-hemolysin-like protein
VPVLLGAWPAPARASFLQGDALDALANGIAWAALIIVPVAAIAVFWIVHILPEKIAEKRRHPQLSAIKTLCLLSLVFGGLLWPIAWLWAYTKPVLHKIAYGTDVDDTVHHGEALSPLEDANWHAAPGEDEVQVLRRRVAALEAQLAAQERAPREGGA